MDIFTDIAMPFVEQPDNDGQPFHETLHDPGGATAWGVTYNLWAAYQNKHNLPADLTTFKSWPKEKFYPYYRVNYWDSCRCGELGLIGIQVFDAAVGSGPGHAINLLKTILGLHQNGLMDDLTIRIVGNTDQVKLANEFCAEREAFYATCREAVYFERGWDRRAEKCRDLVLYYIKSNPDLTTKETQSTLDVSLTPVVSITLPNVVVTQTSESSADELNESELNNLAKSNGAT